MAAQVVPIVVTEDWSVPDGSETPTGTVEFALTAEILSPAYVAARLVDTTIVDGEIAQQLVANDLDSTGSPITPSTTMYRVREVVDGATEQTYFVRVPAVPAESRSVADGVLTSGSNVLTSATAAWTSDDVGAYVLVAGLPPGTRVQSITSSTQAVMTQVASAAATGLAVLIGASVTLSSIRPPA